MAVAGVSQNGRKSDLHWPENQLPLARIKLFFKNWISLSPQTKKKTLNKRILFQVDKKLVSTSGMEEFV